MDSNIMVYNQTIILTSNVYVMYYEYTLKYYLQFNIGRYMFVLLGPYNLACTLFYFQTRLWFQFFYVFHRIYVNLFLKAKHFFQFDIFLPNFDAQYNRTRFAAAAVVSPPPLQSGLHLLFWCVVF